MSATVYLETTIPSYLAARPSRDLITAAHQQLTLEWWQNRRAVFRLYISELVLEEAALGDRDMAQRRLDHLAGIPSLEITAPAQALAQSLLSSGLLPAKASRRRIACRDRGRQWHGLSSYMEHTPPRQRGDSPRDRRGVSAGGLGGSCAVHAGRVDGGLRHAG